MKGNENHSGMKTKSAALAMNKQSGRRDVAPVTDLDGRDPKTQILEKLEM